MPSFRIHSSTLIWQNSIFKEILGRVLTHSGFYRKESSFLPFFELTFTDKIRPEKAQLAVGPDNVTVTEVCSTCRAPGIATTVVEGWRGRAQMHAECCSSDLDDVSALYPLLCSFNFQKGNFKIAYSYFSQKGEKDNFSLKKITNPFTAIFLATKTEPGTQQVCNNCFDERMI